MSNFTHQKHLSGTYWCNPAHPMPKNHPAETKWLHENVREVKREKEGEERTLIYYACPDCGKEWMRNCSNWMATVVLSSH